MDSRLSRAAEVTKALMKYQRRKYAEEDAEIYRTQGDYPDMAVASEWASTRTFPACVASCDNIHTVPIAEVRRAVGYLRHQDEAALALALINAFDLQVEDLP